MGHSQQWRSRELQMVDLSKKVALITGVTRQDGNGAAVALDLATAGADICTGYFRSYDRQMPWGVREGEPEEILGKIRETGVKAVGFEADLTQSDGPKELFARAQAEFGRIDILVNNAAYSCETRIDAMTAADLDRHYAVNLRAAVLLSQAFVNGFTSGRMGRIINLTSGQGMAPMPDELAYAASKGGVEAFP